MGDIVSFGSYEQDANLDNGQEPIEWYIIKKDGNKALLLSKDNIVYQAFDENMPLYEEEKIALWSTSTIREYLNNNFINDAFSEKQQSMILDTYISGTPDADFILKDDNTTDKIFILSCLETINLSSVEKNVRNSDYVTIMGGEDARLVTRNTGEHTYIFRIEDDQAWRYLTGYELPFRPAMNVSLEALDYDVLEPSVSNETSEIGNYFGVSFEQAIRSASHGINKMYINHGEMYYPIPKEMSEVSGKIVKTCYKDFIIPKVQRGDKIYAFDGNNLSRQGGEIRKLGRKGYSSEFTLQINYDFSYFNYLCDEKNEKFNRGIQYKDINGISLEQFTNYVEDKDVMIIGTFWHLFYEQPTTVDFKYFQNYQM